MTRDRGAVTHRGIEGTTVPPQRSPPEEEPPEIIIRTPSKGHGKDKKDDHDGGLAEADPDHPEADESWLPPVEISDPNIEWNRLYLNFTVTEEAVWIARVGKKPSPPSPIC